MKIAKVDIAIRRVDRCGDWYSGTLKISGGVIGSVQVLPFQFRHSANGPTALTILKSGRPLWAVEVTNRQEIDDLTSGEESLPFLPLLHALMLARHHLLNHGGLACRTTGEVSCPNVATAEAMRRALCS